MNYLGKIPSMTFDELRKIKVIVSRVISGKSSSFSLDMAKQIQQAIENREDSLEREFIAAEKLKGAKFKQCTICKISKPLLDHPCGFNFRSGKPPSPSCKRCERNRVKIHHASKPDIGRERAEVNQLKRQKAGAVLTDTEKARLRALQGDKCAYCGEELQGKGELDHFKPVAQGGLNNLSNRVFACSTCNKNKGRKTPDEFFEYRKAHKLKIRRGGFFRPID
jgi:5-methylcytosine-specific restriction endonuclease McrA